MSIGAPVAADVPHLFDVVINGQGYIFLRTIDTSLPFRTQRAKYSATETFLERTNVSGAYGDDSQSFFLTSSQNDWSMGEQQRFYRIADPDSKRRYWIGSNVDVATTPGSVTLSAATKTLTLAAASAGAVAIALNGAGSNLIYYADATNLYTVSGAGVVASLGAHGAGATIYPRTVIAGPVNIYVGGSTRITKYRPGVGFSSFSATLANSLAYVNNTVYAISSNMDTLRQYDTAGVATDIYAWKDGDGTTDGVGTKMLSYGGKLLILRCTSDVHEGAELWVYDGTVPTKVAGMPPNFFADSLAIVDGIVFIGGGFALQNTAKYKSGVYYYVNGTIGLLWKATGTSANLTTTSVAAFNDGLVFTDETLGSFMFYSPSTGGISTLGSFTQSSLVFPSNTGSYTIASGGTAFFHERNSTSAWLYPDTVTATTGFVASSLMDFDNTLTKLFRGVKVDFTAGTDGNGGSVDIAYQVDSVDGAYTTLQSSAVSGTEYTLSGVSGHSISVKVTLNKGTSTLGPTLKRIYVRGVPVLQSFRNCEYILDCSSVDGRTPLILNDNETAHPLDGLQQAVNIRTAIASTSPISITDRFSTYSAIIEPGPSEIIEISPEEYIVRVATREV